MTLKFLILLETITLLVSCNNQSQESKSNMSSAKAVTLNCYRYINNNDTVILKTNSINGFVTGTLVYNLYQKDKNMGNIQGQMKGELLIADYSFNSEGVQSVRQIVFKKDGRTLIEGYGEAVEKNGKSTFKNIDSLDFDHSIILGEVDCQE